jgi:predicted chitinase
MLISPPFLPARQANQTDDDWLAATMDGARPGDGFFPVSYDLGWHGGIHITAPVAGAGTERVRAVADGTVIFKRASSARSTDKDHPLNYRGGWTDDGCVVLRHETAIGEGPNASSITFFSVYMHLSEVTAAIVTGRKVSRKDDLGQAGQIYGGTVRKLHFELLSDEANTRRLLGRISGDVNVAQNGRTDAVYGDTFIHIPAGAKIYGEKPVPQQSAAHKQPPKPSPQAPWPPLQALTETHTTTIPLVVGIRHSGATLAQRGDAIVSTLNLDGSPIGTPIREAEANYNMYAQAIRISAAFPAQSRPAPSVVFEILRFGRLINTDVETAPATAVPHWREIHYPGGRGWVNLNASGTSKFSEADFPQWCGWSIIDDAGDSDSRCDSQLIMSWLGSNGGAVDPIQAAVGLADSAVEKKLGRSICKFPSEWNAATIDQRWRWLTVPAPANPQPMNDTDFAELKAHIAALCFDAAALDSATWHWPPKEFIRHFRRCGWLSENELVRCIPSRYQTEQGQRGTTLILPNMSPQLARQRVANRNPAVFMKVCRKYDVDKRQRLAHFLAQIYRESGVLHWDQELASGAEYQGRADLGNTHPGDGIRYKGRGLIQTTGKTNYEKYSEYRGKRGANSFVVEPNNFLLATDPYNCADTAGLYWVSRATGAHGTDININRVADLGIAEADLRAVTRNVNGAENGPWTGLVERRSHLSVLNAVLLDTLPQLSPAIERRNA